MQYTLTYVPDNAAFFSLSHSPTSTTSIDILNLVALEAGEPFSI